MADEEKTEDVPEEKSGGMMKIIIMGVGGLVLLAIGIFAGPLVMNMISPPDAEVAAEGEVEETPSGPPIYQSLHPPLVVNVKDERGDAHFMQITMEVMSRDQEVINAVREHTPVIRNALILMFGTSMYESVSTREGKEEMLSNALTEIQNVMTDRIGETGVEEVYFTALVVQ